MNQQFKGHTMYTQEKPMLINDDNFTEIFKPIDNHITADECQQMFETYGDELEFVWSQPDNRVWTMMDGDNGACIVNGYHTVNRIGYFVCEVPYNGEPLSFSIGSNDDDEQAALAWGDELVTCCADCGEECEVGYYMISDCCKAHTYTIKRGET